jgi:hypothetical protein
MSHIFFYNITTQFTTNKNIKIVCNKPVYERNILKITNNDEYFTLIYNKKKKIYQLYHRGYINVHKGDSHKQLIMVNNNYFFYHNQITCYLESTDAVTFKKVLKNNQYNALLKEGSVSHNFSVFYDKDDNLVGMGGRQLYKISLSKTNHPHVCQKSTKYMNVKVFTKDQVKYTQADKKTNILKIVSPKYVSPCNSNGLHLYKSDDGVKWKKAQKLPIISGLNGRKINGYSSLSVFDSITSCVYDDKNDRYILYQRANPEKQKRYICYTTSKDLIKWEEFKFINIKGCNYHTDSFYCPYVCKINSFYICFSPHMTFNKKGCYTSGGIVVLMSEDGINWIKVGYQFDYYIDPKRNSMYNSFHMHDIVTLFPTAGTPIINNNNQYFYIRNKNNDILERYGMREYGFTYLESINKNIPSEFTTKLITTKYDNISINYQTISNGYVLLGLLDENKKEILNFTINDCKKLTGNCVNKIVEWKDGTLPQKYYIYCKFYNANIFAINFNDDTCRDFKEIKAIDKKIIIDKITTMPKFGTKYKKKALNKILELYNEKRICEENMLRFINIIKARKDLR